MFSSKRKAIVKREFLTNLLYYDLTKDYPNCICVYPDITRCTKKYFLLPDLHGFHFSSSKSVPDTAHIHSRPNQALQREEDRRTATAYIRYRG